MPRVNDDDTRGRGRMRMDSPAVLKTGESVRLVFILPAKPITISRDGSFTYTLVDDDVFEVAPVDEFGRLRLVPGVASVRRVRYDEIDRID